MHFALTNSHSYPKIVSMSANADGQPSMESEAKIFIRQPGAAPSPCTLPAGEYTVGRSEKCRIRLRHPEVSELHAVLRIVPGESTVEDKGSSNGTWVFGGHPRPDALPGDCGYFLRSVSLTFHHPITGEKMTPSVSPMV